MIEYVEFIYNYGEDIRLRIKFYYVERPEDCMNRFRVYLRADLARLFGLAESDLTKFSMVLSKERTMATLTMQTEQDTYVYKFYVITGKDNRCDDALYAMGRPCVSTERIVLSGSITDNLAVWNTALGALYYDKT